jgi:hypothetical protein
VSAHNINQKVKVPLQDKVRYEGGRKFQPKGDALMSSNDERPSLLKRVGKLYQLLERAFPGHRSKQDVLAIPQLADDLGYAHETLYRCVRRDRIKVEVARKLLEFSHQNQPASNHLYWQDLAPFVLPDYDRFSDPLSD